MPVIPVDSQWAIVPQPHYTRAIAPPQQVLLLWFPQHVGFFFAVQSCQPYYAQPVFNSKFYFFQSGCHPKLDGPVYIVVSTQLGGDMMESYFSQRYLPERVCSISQKLILNAYTTFHAGSRYALNTYVSPDTLYYYYFV